MSQNRMLRQAFQALLNGDTAERDRLCAQMERTNKDPWSNLSTETDKAMAKEVSQLTVDIVGLFRAQCPGLFNGDARDTAIATMALAEALGGVIASVQMHGDETRVARVVELFKKRVSESSQGILSRVASVPRN